jgi:uncharacterized protein YbaR (Trm112 family)
VYTAPLDFKGGRVPLDKRLLEVLCCPSCRGELAELEGGAGLRCGGCGRVYPIVDGIPNLLVEDAGPPESTP